MTFSVRLCACVVWFFSVIFLCFNILAAVVVVVYECVKMLYIVSFFLSTDNFELYFQYTQFEHCVSFPLFVFRFCSILLFFFGCSYFFSALAFPWLVQQRKLIEHFTAAETFSRHSFVLQSKTSRFRGLCRQKLYIFGVTKLN